MIGVLTLVQNYRRYYQKTQKSKNGIDNAQILLGHTTPNMTIRYNHRRLQNLKEMARNRKNVFEE